MEPLLTKGGQSPLDLAREFVTNLSACKSGSDDMDQFFDYIVSKEFDPVVGKSDKIVHTIQHVGEWDAFHMPLIETCRPKFTYSLLAWICLQSNGIPEAVETMFGMLACVFYSTHSREETMSLQWLKEIGCGGKILTMQQQFPYSRAAVTVIDGAETNIYRVLSPEALYLAG